VLAGAIGMSSILGAAGLRYGTTELGGPSVATAKTYNGGMIDLGRARADVAAVPGVRASFVLDRYTVWDENDTGREAVVAGCPTLRALIDLTDCRDGDAFVVSGTAVESFVDGHRLAIRSPGQDDAATPGVPVHLPPLRALPYTRGATQFGGLVATPGALPDLRQVRGTPVLMARYDPAVPDVADRIRTALAPLQWRADVQLDPLVTLTQDQDRFADIRRGLLAGTLLTLALVAATMVVAAVEQVRERRRPLAALAAAGVSRAMLARSLLWQNAVPLVLAVAVADVLGALLGALVLRLVGEPVHLDGRGIALYSAAAVLAAAVATALTLPAIVRATRPAGLRAE
jgi:hypothetical protein